MAPGLQSIARAPYKASVLWWAWENVAVVCPFCAEVESHGIHSRNRDSYWTKCLMLKALCSHSGLIYQATFPWELGLSWEKNWARSRIDTIGFELSHLDIGRPWQPATFIVAGPPLEAREDFKKGRITEGLPGTHTLSHRAKQIPKRDGRESRRAKGREETSTLGSEIQTPPFSPRMVLGDMRLMISLRLPKSIKILAPSATVDGIRVSDPLAVISSCHRLTKKTTAVLDRRGPFMPIIAVSGWNDSISRPENRKVVLDQNLWTKQVLMLSEYVTHKLHKHNLDHGTEGRALASHAEKQLIAFFIREHYFLEDGYEDVEMEKLKSLQPQFGLREAYIAIDKPVCEDCLDFKDKVEAVCKVKFHFVQMKRRIEDAAEARTPIRPKAARFQPITPPASGRRLSDEAWRRSNEEEQYEEEEADESDPDDYVENGEPESPCQQSYLRSLGGGRRHTTTNNASYHSDTSPAFPVQKAKKRPQSELSDESYIDSYDEQGNSPPPSPRRRNPMVVKRSRCSINSATIAKRPLPLRVYDNLQADNKQGQPEEQARRNGNNWLSDEEKLDAINEVWDVIEKREQEEAQRDEDASIDSDTPIAPRREGSIAFPVDLTGDSSQEDAGSDGSWYFP